MTLIEINVKSTDPLDESRTIFCDLTLNKSTGLYGLEYIGLNDQIRNEMKEQSSRLIDELKSCEGYDSIFSDL